jgi:hypothetical protein
MDIGCNDGTLFDYFPAYVKTVGFDPAQNIEIRDDRIDIFYNGYFDPDMYDGRRPKIITSIAMFYDLDDPRRFVEGIDKLLHTDGVWIVEMHYLLEMLRQVTFDAICHEHLTYWTLSAFMQLLQNVNLQVQKVERHSINGGSMRIYVGRRTKRSIHASVCEWLVQEQSRLDGELERFPVRVQQAKYAMLQFIEKAHADGRTIFGYGASTKGNTLLEFYGLGPSHLPYIADRQDFKWGLKTAGTSIPIISEEAARALRPDYLLALPYHLLQAFLNREHKLLAAGTKFVVPLPEVTCHP